LREEEVPFTLFRKGKRIWEQKNKRVYLWTAFGRGGGDIFKGVPVYQSHRARNWYRFEGSMGYATRTKQNKKISQKNKKTQNPGLGKRSISRRGEVKS